MKEKKPRHKVQHIKIRETARKAIDYLHDLEKFNFSNFLNRLIIQLALELSWRQDEILDVIAGSSEKMKGKESEELIGTSFRPTDETREALEFLKSLPTGFNLSRYAAEAIIKLAKKKGWRGP